MRHPPLFRCQSSFQPHPLFLFPSSLPSTSFSHPLFIPSIHSRIHPVEEILFYQDSGPKIVPFAFERTEKTFTLLFARNSSVAKRKEKEEEKRMKKKRTMKVSQEKEDGKRMMKVSQDLQVVHFTSLTWMQKVSKRRMTIHSTRSQIKLKPIPPFPDLGHRLPFPSSLPSF